MNVLLFVIGVTLSTASAFSAADEKVLPASPPRVSAAVPLGLDATAPAGSTNAPNKARATSATSRTGDVH